MPAWASADTSSRTYTFIPPLSPEPGWARGDVCSESMANRCTVRSVLRGTGRDERRVRHDGQG